MHLLRRIDDELAARGHERLFFHAADRPFKDPWHWGTLVHLLNEDYENLVVKKDLQRSSPGKALLERLERAMRQAGAKTRLDVLPTGLHGELAAALDKEAAELAVSQMRNYPDTLKGKTLLIEFARGGPQGSAMPLPAPLGYRHSLGCLSEDILRRAAVLYVWVTPEDSRRKNLERADPNDPGSILHHSVPREVMLNDYGTDDVADLVSADGSFMSVRKGAKEYRLPFARFDNRQDRTSFIRGERAQWAKSDVDAIHGELKLAFAGMRQALAVSR